MQMLGFPGGKGVSCRCCCHSKHSEVRAPGLARRCCGHWGLLGAAAKRPAQQQVGSSGCAGTLCLAPASPSPTLLEDADPEEVWGRLCSLGPGYFHSPVMWAKGQGLGFSEQPWG